MKKIVFATFSVLLLSLITPTACYYDNEQEQYGVVECDTSVVSYAADIVPIINQNCISCHAPGGQQESSPFDSYDNFTSYVISAVDRINGRGSLMPPEGKMSKCNIAMIEAWVNAGAPNN